MKNMIYDRMNICIIGQCMDPKVRSIEWSGNHFAENEQLILEHEIAVVVFFFFQFLFRKVYLDKG